MRAEERVGERTRIARELHDSLLQSLAGVSLQLDVIAKQATKTPEKVGGLIAHVREQLDYAFREARVKVWNLRSPAFEGQTLPAVVREIEEQLKWRFGGASEAADRELSIVLVEILHELHLTDEALKTLQQKCIDRRRAAVRRIKAAFGGRDATQVTWQRLLMACRRLIFIIREFSVTRFRFSR